MNKLILYLLFLPFIARSQEAGINFQDNLSWQQILAKAKAENKFVFVDCFTTWCGPCKNMSMYVFPKKEVGDFYNRHFISVSVQLDTTKKDSETIKKWYADAHAFMLNYRISSFPTFLYFSPEGKAVHRSVGAQSSNDLIAAGQNAMNPDKQYYSQVYRYVTGDRDSGLLKELANTASLADRELAIEVANAYIDKMAVVFDKNHLEFIHKYTNSTRHKGFSLLIDSMKRVDEILGENAAASVLLNVIHREEGVPFYPSVHQHADWKTLESYLIKKYPAIGAEAFLHTKLIYYYRKKDYKTYAELYDEYLAKYRFRVGNYLLNAWSWDLFTKTSDKTALKLALKWCKMNTDVGEIGADTDTYANILYELGNKEEAIKWEQKAILLADGPEQKKEFEEVLEKMKKGEPTRQK